MEGKGQNRLNYIWRFGKKHIPFFIIAEICILVSYASSVLLPMNLTRLTDRVLYGGEFELLGSVIRDYCLLFFISTIFNFIYAFVWQYLNNHYVLDVKKEMYKKVVYAKSSFLSGSNSGDLMTRIDHDSEQFIHVVQRNFFHFINSTIMCIGIIVLVAKINTVIAILLLIASVLPILITRLCGRIIEKYARESRRISGEWNGRMYEVLKGFREIKLLNALSWADKNVIKPLKQLLRLENKTRRVELTVSKGIDLINLLSNLTIYGFSSYFVIQGKITVGHFLALIQYVSLLHRKFNWILRIWLDWYSRKVSIDRVSEILELDSENCGTKHIERINTVKFQNVDFEYEEGCPVLKDFNLSINTGEKIGIVGHSGNGKTTITSLLLGFYQVNNGTILINGIPLEDVDQAQMRKKIGVVSQDVMIFEDTIRYNLSLGNDYSDDEIYSALDAVKLLDIVNALPKGVDTVISPASHNLSGGQKQRLMIARMLLRKPSFIILDEATSSLDVETEKLITQMLNEKMMDATLIVISHRFESIRNCQKIVVLNDHTVEAIGTHESLIGSSDTYKALYGR